MYSLPCSESNKWLTTGPWSTVTSRFASAAIGRYLLTTSTKATPTRRTAGEEMGEEAMIGTKAPTSAHMQARAWEGDAGGEGIWIE